MADNVAITAGSGTNIAADDISSVWYQRVKLVSGDDGISPRDLFAGDYETVAASQTDQVMGASGAQYDYLAGVLIIPSTTSPGAVSIKDGNGSAISIFAGGTDSVTSLHPFFVPLGIVAVNGTSAGWKITTGSNVTAIGIGTFT